MKIFLTILLCIFIFTTTPYVDAGEKDYYALYKKYKWRYKKYKRKYKELGVLHESLHLDYVQCLRVNGGVNPYEEMINYKR